MNIKSQLWFIYRWIVWIKDTLFDRPILENNLESFSIWKTVLWQDIEVYKFWDWEETILYFWWIHGNEVWTVKLMTRWINFLKNNENIIPKNKSVFVIPCLNRDSYKKALQNPNFFSGGNIGKTNANNVDLNRNFPTKNWSKTSKLFLSWKYYDVSWWDAPASEPEVKSLMSFIEKENISTTYIFHSCWGTVMGTFLESCDKKVQDYVEKSPYRIFTQKEWKNVIDGHKAWHSMTWWEENNLDIVEIELKTRWWSEWKDNETALVSSLSL